MKYKHNGYNVYHAPDGAAPRFVGFARSLREARRMAAVARRTGRMLEQALWATAQAAGHCAGLEAPSGVEAAMPRCWFGRGGEYCAVPVRTGGNK
jgi:hypothetical protein